MDLPEGLSLWAVGLSAALALQPLTLGRSLPLWAVSSASKLEKKLIPLAVQRTHGLAAGQRRLTADLGKALALSL